MTPPPNPVIPNLGRYASFGIGRQLVAGTPVKPEHFLRMNGGSSLTPTVQFTDDNYANASFFQTAGRPQGRTMQGKTINFEVEHKGLVLLLGLALNADPTAGTITPSMYNYDNNMPLPPCTVEANVPGSPTRAVDAQFHNLQLTMNNRANFTGQAGFMAVTGEDMADPAPAVLPVDGVYRFKDHFIEYGGGSVQPETSTLTLDAAIAAIDAARGDQAAASDFIFGFERNGLLALTGQFGVAGVPKLLLDAYRNGSTAPLSWVLRHYAPNGTDVLREVRFTIPNAQLSLVEPPMGMDRIVTPVSWKATSSAGEPPFTVDVIG